MEIDADIAVGYQVVGQSGFGKLATDVCLQAF